MSLATCAAWLRSCAMSRNASRNSRRCEARSRRWRRTRQRLDVRFREAGITPRAQHAAEIAASVSADKKDRMQAMAMADVVQLDEPDEPGEYASPACSMHEADPNYFGFATNG